MTDNRSSRWERESRQPRDVHDDLIDLLDRADVSERVRAAIAFALATPETLSSYLIALGPTERERPAARRWTLHLSYLATDLMEARDQAVVYTEGLTTLRPEVAAGAALLSRADAWHHVEPVFCGRSGPDNEVCMDVNGHPGFHSAAGIGGLCWGDGDGSSAQ
ncbi:hypothetical protein [Micromonospora sp. CA-246542]|uniref:hypothetical protein n=1 Tax=Micromonospora sp. CA-246542 TaxID=3239959 RepID=UPI003D8EB99C